MAEPHMRVSIIVAAAENGVIGRNNQLPWRLSADLRRFKELTMGHAVIMGRKTYESIGRPLPGRTMIVITSQADYQPPNAVAVSNFGEAVAEAARHGETEAFVIGGARVFQSALPIAERLYLTRVHADVEGDVYLPALDPSAWRLLESQPRQADERNQYPFTFQRYERVLP
jgi:dihydrofolate reductase